tara:strand:+ start:29696 stop:31813 length:2118 start_codon:yes stop_codon:yes gene_type:complete
MKQIVQNLDNGKTILEEIPVPSVSEGNVLIKTHKTLVSLGTEKMLVEFGKANYFDKARQQPEKVRQVLNKIKTDGLKPTLNAVFRKLGEPLPLGYCNSGEVIGLGKNVKKFKIGDRVISNGSHAEVVNIPENLVAKIPENVTYEKASFTVVGAIGLQGIRLINPTFGETIVVIGLGLIGLITVQLLKANGCRVIGLDYDSKKVQLAKSWGVDAFTVSNTETVNLVKEFTNGVGADGVIITASSKGNEVISEAAQMSRQRGRIILVGVVGLDINRSDMYEKELTFQVSCSYGPGRHNTNYENKGLDFPVGYVRWTEQRNFEAILNAISSKVIDLESLITDRVELIDYGLIYENLSKKDSIATIINYDPKNLNISRKIIINNKNFSKKNGVIGVIGSGNFTGLMILPALKKCKANIKSIASSKGLSGTTLAKKYSINESTSDIQTIYNDKEIDSVVITTRHNQHAKHVIEALESGKNVFVEKPLAITSIELNNIQKVYNKSNNSLIVGFNRRFSKFTVDAKKAIGEKGQAINVVATMNAGFIPLESWVQDLETGGGRIIGEACHYIDLISFLCQSQVESVVMNSQGLNPEKNTDNVSILLRYKNGSQGVINYFSDGNKSYQKERIEIYDQGKNIVIDNFRKISFYGYNTRGYKKSQDKGHFEQFNRWNQMIVKGLVPIISFESIINTSKTAFACLESLTKKSWIDIE